MCLSSQALYVFLSLFPADMVTLTPERVILHAEVRDAHWVYNGETWCTMAPQIDASHRLTPGA